MTESLWSKFVRNGQAFSAENFVIGAGGLDAHVQLYNPVSSGVRVRLRSAHVISVIAATTGVRRHDVALTTLGLPAGFIVENLLAGQPVSVAEMRSESPVGALGTIIWQVSANGNTPALYPGGGREWGFDLLEGQGLVFQAATGATLIVNMQWVEVQI